MKKISALILVIAILLLPFSTFAQMNKDFDLIIKNGRIVDGTGNPWFYGDVAIKNGKIEKIGKIDASRAERVINARNKIVAPGFIDVHGHIEGGIEKLSLAENMLQMGVTSIVTGNCGFSRTNLQEWFSTLEKSGISINVASLIGHNAVRKQGMNGDFDRPPSEAELRKMREIVAQAMKDGAVGFSTGLEYVPGIYAKTDEIVALAKESGSRGGIYTTHMRDEGIAVEEAIAESLKVGELAECPVEISHFKISAKKRWGFSKTTLEMVEEARRKGHQVTIDQYLYTAGATYIDIIFPAWVFDGGEAKVKENLTNPETRKRVRDEMLAKAAAQGFEDVSFVQITSFEKNPAFVGKRLNQIAREYKNDDSPQAQAELAIEIRLNGGAGVIVHKMSDEDVDRIFQKPFTMIAADAGILDINSTSSPHPRGFGNNARVLARYVREKKLVSLEEAIRKMASLPAQTFGLWDRGILRQGMAADIVIFDENIVADRATFQQPKQFATGFDYVIVNGRLTIEKGKHSGTKAGRILRSAGF
jgi:N-acyl-D-amino-acid deacylase